MSINSLVLDTLKPILSNTWAVELPPEPTWPAIVFDIETIPEQQWVQGGGYNQHFVTVTVLAKTKQQVHALNLQIINALQQLPTYLRDEERGDAEYEGDASVYAYFSNHVIRLNKDQG